MALDPLSQIFAALADPTRRAILARLAEGDHVVGDLAKPFAMSAPAITKHLKTLERAGLITRNVEGQWRRCHLTAEPLAQAVDWLDRYRRFWESGLTRLETYLEQLQSEDKGNDPDNPS